MSEISYIKYQTLKFKCNRLRSYLYTPYIVLYILVYTLYIVGIYIIYRGIILGGCLFYTLVNNIYYE